MEKNMVTLIIAEIVIHAVHIVLLVIELLP